MTEHQPTGLEALEKERKIEYVRVLLSDIQSGVLIGIFQHIFVRSGLSFDESKFIYPVDVEVVYMETALAGNCYDGRIMVNAYHVAYEDEGKSRANVLKTYIHELTHALSKGIPATDAPAQDGYSVGGARTGEYVGTNEAMTELIQDQVFRAYLKQSGDRNLLTSESGVVRKRLSYPSERKEVLSLIDDASAHFGIPKADILRALIVGYFSNDTAHMVEFFSEVIPEGVSLNEYLAELRESGALKDAAKTLHVEL